MADQSKPRKKWYRGWWWKLPVLVIAVGVMINAGGNLLEGDYSDFPKCDGAQGIASVIATYNKGMQEQNVEALDVSDIFETKHDPEKTRECRAIIFTNRGQTVAISYRWFRRNDNVLIQVTPLHVSEVEG